MSKRTFTRWAAIAAAACVAFLPAILCEQQAQPAEPSRFEVAAIKPSSPGQPNSLTSGAALPGGTIRFVNLPLKQWVERALSMSDYVVKGPSWLDGARFDLEAKIPEGKAVTQDDVNEMLLTLLTERFGLKWHTEQQNMPGYEMVAGKKLLLKPWDPKEPTGRSRGPALIGGLNMPMSELATTVAEVLQQPVIDSTHMSGGYDVKLLWRPDDDALASSLGKQMKINMDDLPSSLAGALQEQAGLRLNRANVPWTFVIVDSINHTPTDN